jgi:K+-sensing histidine kinase KdpD
VNVAVDAVPGGVLTLSGDLRILAANRGLGELADCDPADLVGQLFDVLLSAPSRILFQTHVYPALTAEGRVQEVFLTLASKTGASTPVLFNATRTTGAEPVTYDGLIVRIPARARWEMELLAATRALERERAASQQLARDLEASVERLAVSHEEERRNHQFRDAFIGVVSHELRTPITTIFGMSHVLLDRHRTMAPDVIGEHLADIASESDRLRRLTEDLLVLSRAEGRQLLVAAEPIVVGHIVRGAVQAEQSRSTGHEFVVEVAADVPLAVGEAVHVDQVVRNLLSNAAKYSPSGTTVRVTVDGEDGGVAVRVIDEGPGLPDAEAPDQLFEVFYRAPDAARQSAGAGIGLFVCRELIAAMGGRVWAAPNQRPSGTGAEFGFWLPADDVDAADAADAAEDARTL